MSKVFDSDGLNDLFDLDDVIENASKDLSEDVIDVESEDIPEVAVQKEKSIDNLDFIDLEIKRLLSTSNSLMDAARYLVESSPDPESVSAASSMIASIGHIIGECNKMVLMKERYKEQTKLEKLKISARKQLAEFKAANEKAKLILGSGNTFNIQNNGLVPYSQSSTVREILKAEKEKEPDQIGAPSEDS